MLSENEKTEILALHKKGEVLSEGLKTKLLESIKKGEPSIFNDGNYLCCTYQDTVGARQFVWTTFDNCRIVGGSAADNSMCGH